MLLSHPLLTCADASPDLCTFCPDLCTLHPDLCTLCLWCYLSMNQRKYSTCTHGGGHWLQLALVAFFLQLLAQTLYAPVWCHPLVCVHVRACVCACVSPLKPVMSCLSCQTRRVPACCVRVSCMWWWLLCVCVVCVVVCVCAWCVCVRVHVV